MKNSTNQRRRKTVSIWKRSVATTAEAWALRKAAHERSVRCGDGSTPASLRIFQTVEAAMVCPRPTSSPWMRR
jgi:hypothetical protein